MRPYDSDQINSLHVFILPSRELMEPSYEVLQQKIERQSTPLPPERNDEQNMPFLCVSGSPVVIKSKSAARKTKSCWEPAGIAPMILHHMRLNQQLY